MTSPTDDPLLPLSLLDETLDDLAPLLTPLTTSPGLPALTCTLPIVDQARLSVLTVYTVESLLFTYLRLNGIDAKTHPVMTELARVRGYVAKINAATEKEKGKRPVGVDKEAVGRFVKAGLQGNEKVDREREAREKGEAEGARRLFEEVSRRVERREVEVAEAEERVRELEEGKKRQNEEQVNRILESFRSHGVKRGSEDESAGGDGKRRRRKGRKGK